MIEWMKAYWTGRVTSLAAMPRGDIVAAGVAEKETLLRDKHGPYRAILGGGFVARLDRGGNVKWFRLIHTESELVITDVKAVDDWEIIACGWMEERGLSGHAGVVFKFDGDGNLIWARKFYGGISDTFSALAVTQDGGTVVVGETRSFGAGVSDALVLRLDRDGNFVWWGTYGGRLWDGAESAVIDGSGRIVVAGYTYSFSECAPNVWLLWLDDNGDVIMEKTYGTESLEKAVGIALTRGGDPVVVGKTYDPMKSRYDAWALRLNREGEPRWGLRFPGKEVKDISVSPDGDLVLGMGDFTLVGLSSGGKPQWGGRLRLKRWSELEAVLVNGNVLAGGKLSWEKVLIASISPEGKPPGAVGWDPGMGESQCTVFEAYSNGRACFKAVPNGRLTEMKLKSWEFEPDVFGSLRELVRSRSG
ncbi:PQQ-binding-like beta-propeller repeat protein [Thermococcus aciditolerans]|uniref:PQQ-like beta-propeller repeat protein n=1 Tax=Thermococcus aciditolerans TaxID=2598455 RepID=A0A5C0SM24_9EURY|nr:PQQ-binding-like beta-propeller repeat protein [Thermococcus aciditolerans]QEK14484.1 PQQ-like beta-propeller repeat protein [Thermococcus aciditolerans]